MPQCQLPVFFCFFVPERQKISILGITFKPDVDDIRESPALWITEQVAQRYPDAEIHIVEPNLTALPPQISNFPNVLHSEFEKSVKDAEIIVVLVDHILFKQHANLLSKHKHLIDTRGVLQHF